MLLFSLLNNDVERKGLLLVIPVSNVEHTSPTHVAICKCVRKVQYKYCPWYNQCSSTTEMKESTMEYDFESSYGNWLPNIKDGDHTNRAAVVSRSNEPLLSPIICIKQYITQTMIVVLENSTSCARSAIN